MKEYEIKLNKMTSQDEKIKSVNEWIGMYKDCAEVTKKPDKRKEYLQEIDKLEILKYKLEHPQDEKIYIRQRDVYRLNPGNIYVCEKQYNRIKESIDNINQELEERCLRIGKMNYELNHKKGRKKNATKEYNIFEDEYEVKKLKEETIPELRRQMQEMEYHFKMKNVQLS